MHAALYHGDRHAANCTQHQHSRVARDRGLREVRNLRIGDRDGVRDLGGESAQTRAEDDADAWGQADQREDMIDGFLRFAEEIYHGCSRISVQASVCEMRAGLDSIPTRLSPPGGVVVSTVFATRCQKFSLQIFDSMGVIVKYFILLGLTDAM